MAELQEVQITEEKPLLPGQTPEVAKVMRPLTPRPEFQTCRHPPRLLPSRTHNHSNPQPRFLHLYPCLSPVDHNGSPGLCPVTALTFILSCLFVSSLSVSTFLYLCLSPSVTRHGCVSLRVSVYVCLSRRLS